MITYNDLYELLRKEKYSETLQPLPKRIVEDFAEYIAEKNTSFSEENDLFADSVAKSKKQLENAISLFKELILRRKKKILNLIFIATETGITKRDYENLLQHEKIIFDKMTKAFEEADKEVSRTISGKKLIPLKNKLILFNQEVDQFVDSQGNLLGPFKSGELVNIEKEIAEILVSGNKASFIDEN